MKKLFFFILLVMCFDSGHGQSKGSDVTVEYQAFFNTDSPVKMYTYLYTGGNVAVYQEKYSTKEDWVEKKKPDNLPPGAIVTVSKGIPDDSYYRIDRNKKEVLFYDNIMRHKFLVKDTFPDMTWDITNETKTVAGLQCIKAITNFRGRQWIAWFAPEIPIAFGPWKLQGLPGLILEAYDSTERYAMKATRVEYRKGDIVSKDFTKLFETRNSSPITYQQLLSDREEATNNFHNELAQKMKEKGATITNHPVKRSGEELVFEWEK